MPPQGIHNVSHNIILLACVFTPFVYWFYTMWANKHALSILESLPSYFASIAKANGFCLAQDWGWRDMSTQDVTYTLIGKGLRIHGRCRKILRVLRRMRAGTITHAQLEAMSKWVEPVVPR